MAARRMPWISADEFLDQEALSETKHMYYGGVVTAMAGGTFEHGRLAMNLGGQLYGALRGRGCAVLGGDVMFQTGSLPMLTYPDLMVVCGPVERMQGRRTVITNPMFLVEVLSPSTEGKDRGEKSHEYRLSPTIRQYALVSQDRPLVEIHTRGADGNWWISEVMGLEAECAFSSLECSVPMAALYEGVLETGLAAGG
ncbi:MAG: Uma2 family endonuclease [Acidobacteria bacterium]|nr:Uma2 family endonuclease [Acidobacteriota bacterium]